MKKVVYISGCLGFIGAAVTRACLRQGWHVIGVDKMTYACNEQFLQEFEKHPCHFKFIKADINDLTMLYDCDYFINCGAETHVDNSIESSDAFISSNVNGVHNLLKLIQRKTTGKRPTLLHFSTDEVYGDITNGEHYETDRLTPSNPYSASKAAADMLILAWARTYGLPYVIVRPTNNYGIGQYVEKLIPKSVKYLTLDRKIDLHNHGTPYRTWLHVDDTARAIIKIIELGITNDIFNISGNIELQNIDVVSRIVQEYFQHPDAGLVHKYVNYMTRPGQDVRYAINDDKIKALGWSATANFDNQLIDVVAYYKANFVW